LEKEAEECRAGSDPRDAGLKMECGGVEEGRRGRFSRRGPFMVRGRQLVEWESEGERLELGGARR